MKRYELENILQNEYFDLANEFGFSPVDIPLRIETWAKNLDYMYDVIYSRIATTAEDLMEYIRADYDLYERATMHSRYILVDDKLTQFVVIPYERIDYLLARVESNATDEEIVEYLKTCLRHEVGHILHTLEVVKQCVSLKEAVDKLNYETYRAAIAYNKFVADLYEKYEDDEEISEYEFNRMLMSKYYSYKPEHVANKLANMNTRRFIELELNVRLGLFKR